MLLKCFRNFLLLFFVCWLSQSLFLLNWVASYRASSICEAQWWVSCIEKFMESAVPRYLKKKHTKRLNLFKMILMQLSHVLCLFAANYEYFRQSSMHQDILVFRKSRIPYNEGRLYKCIKYAKYVDAHTHTHTTCISTRKMLYCTSVCFVIWNNANRQILVKFVRAVRAYIVVFSSSLLCD